ncbi:hypothetical protein [Methanobrevibacter sp.]|uniref:hypothetical protein n=1 Tax=Methanobrevibacter sp. TaxID=66852 RepID=UPI0026DF6E22|nr:hypothetical protein [Methanobrevibacter sp.]MDO5859498.1 hypothetical protein [Methanobrevibacter sp.]
MGKVYNIFDKFSIISIIIGLALGVYLAVNHNDTNLWIESIPFILLFSLIMTIIPIASSIKDYVKEGEKFPVTDLIEAFLLNIAIITICMAFGVVFGSFFIGNVIYDNGKLPDIVDMLLYGRQV